MYKLYDNTEILYVQYVHFYKIINNVRNLKKQSALFIINFRKRVLLKPIKV